MLLPAFLLLLSVSSLQVDPQFRLDVSGGQGTAFSPDGEHVVSGSGTGVVVWSAVTGELQRRIQSDSVVSALAFSPDGTHIAAGMWNGMIDIWELASGRQVLQIGASGLVNCLAFSPTGLILASGARGDYDTGRPGLLTLWNAVSGEEILNRSQSLRDIQALSYSPDGDRIVFSSPRTSYRAPWDDNIYMVDAATLRNLYVLQGLMPGPNHASPVTALVFSPDGERFASGSLDLTIRMWNASNGDQLFHIGHNNTYVSSLAFSGDGNQIAAGYSGKTDVYVWNSYTAQLQFTLLGRNATVRTVAFAPDGLQVAAVGSDDLAVWQIPRVTEAPPTWPPSPAPATPVPTTHAPRTPMPTTTPETPVPTSHAPNRTPVPTSGAPETPGPPPVPTSHAPRTPMPTTGAPETPVPTSHAPRTPVPTTHTPRTPVPTTGVPETLDPSPVAESAAPTAVPVPGWTHKPLTSAAPSVPWQTPAPLRPEIDPPDSQMVGAGSSMLWMWVLLAVLGGTALILGGGAVCVWVLHGAQPRHGVVSHNLEPSDVMQELGPRECLD